MGDIEISPIAHVIQLSVAPVFLLSGIGAMLAVMTNRLGRIIDRARLIGPAITLCTATALLVSTVIAVLFLSAFLHFDASVSVALLFIASMLAGVRK
jgi:hypothetical protein